MFYKKYCCQYYWCNSKQNKCVLLSTSLKLHNMDFTSLKLPYPIPNKITFLICRSGNEHFQIIGDLECKPLKTLDSVVTAKFLKRGCVNSRRPLTLRPNGNSHENVFGIK